MKEVKIKKAPSKEQAKAREEWSKAYRKIREGKTKIDWTGKFDNVKLK